MAEAKKKVYVETSVVSNLTARRSYNCETCKVNGFACPLICTPEQLMKEV